MNVKFTVHWVFFSLVISHRFLFVFSVCLVSTKQNVLNRARFSVNGNMHKRNGILISIVFHCACIIFLTRIHIAISFDNFEWRVLNNKINQTLKKKKKTELIHNDKKKVISIAHVHRNHKINTRKWRKTALVQTSCHTPVPGLTHIVQHLERWVSKICRFWLAYKSIDFFTIAADPVRMLHEKYVLYS